MFLVSSDREEENGVLWFVCFNRQRYDYQRLKVTREISKTSEFMECPFSDQEEPI